MPTGATRSLHMFQALQHGDRNVDALVQDLEPLARVIEHKLDTS